MTDEAMRSRIASRSTPTHLIGIAWVLMIGVLAVGHATALRNSLTVVVLLATLALYLREWRPLPCKAAVSALLLWATASLLWSHAPDVTLGKLRTDLLIPLLAGAAAFYFVRHGAGLRYIMVGTGLGLVLLALCSVFAYVPEGAVHVIIPLQQSSGIVRPLPYWYPGPGDASMFAILAIPLVYVAWSLTRSSPLVRVHVAVIASGVLVVIVLITTNNRNAVLVAPLVLCVQWMLQRASRAEAARAKRPQVRRVVVAASLIAGFLVMALTLEIGARERLIYLHRTQVGESAAVELIAADTRPMIWRYYVARGLTHPWIGYGFGRTVPGIAMNTQADRALAEIEPNAYIHAHNVLLNWWLQLGAVGVALLAGVVAMVLVTATSLSRGAGSSPRARTIRNAVWAMCLATLARNLTDDFLVYGMATMCCVGVAALLGELSRLACAASADERSIERRSLSTRSSPYEYR